MELKLFLIRPYLSSVIQASPQIMALRMNADGLPPSKKTALVSLSAFAVLTVTSFAQAKLDPSSIKLGKVVPSIVKTPTYTLADGPQKHSTPQDWLEVEVSFDTTPEEIDSLDFKYSVLINNMLIDGMVTHVAIPAGKDHFSVIYIAPRTLLQVTREKP